MPSGRLSVAVLLAIYILELNINTSLEKCHNSLREEVGDWSIISFHFTYNYHNLIKTLPYRSATFPSGRMHAVGLVPIIYESIRFSPSHLLHLSGKIDRNYKHFHEEVPRFPSGRMLMVIPISTLKESHY